MNLEYFQIQKLMLQTNRIEQKNQMKKMGLFV